MATYPRFQDHLHRPAYLLQRTLLFALGMMAGAAIAAGVAVAVDGDGSSGSGATVLRPAAAIVVDPNVPSTIQPGLPADVFTGTGVTEPVIDPVTHGFIDGPGPIALGVPAVGNGGGTFTVDPVTRALMDGGMGIGELYDLLQFSARAEPAHAGVGAISPEELTDALRGM